MAEHFTSNQKFAYPDVGGTNWNVDLQNNLAKIDACTSVGSLAVTPHEIPSASLLIDIAGGQFHSSSGPLQAYAGSTSVAVTTATTNYVYLTDAGALVVNTTGFPTVDNCVPLATVIAGATTITSIADSRIYLSSTGAPRGTSGGQLLVSVTESPSTTLHVAVAAGYFVNAVGATVTYAGTASKTLSPSTTTYLWLTDAGVLTTGASFPADTNIVPLASVVTAGSTVTSITDLRIYNMSRGAAPTSSGTVTSVALALPADFTVSGSPVTASGTLTAVYATQSANTVHAGPASGSPAAPTYRVLVAADLPVFVASGASHAPGAVPDPGASAGTTRYLNENGTWMTPTSSPTTTLAVTTPGAYPYTVLSTDAVILVSTSAARSIVLPTGASAGAGRTYLVKDVSGTASSNPITVTVTGGGTIDNSSSAVINLDRGELGVVSDGTNWLRTENRLDVVGGNLRTRSLGTLFSGGRFGYATLNSVITASSWTVASDFGYYPVSYTGGGSTTGTLPAASAYGNFCLDIKDVGSNAYLEPIVIAPAGTDTIDGVNASIKIQSNQGYVRLYCDGVSNWSIIASKGVALKQQQIDSSWGAVTTDTWSSGLNFDLSISNLHAVVLTGTGSILTTSGDTVGQEFQITMIQDSTGSRTVLWWSGIKWAGGSAPTLTTTANKADIFRFQKLGTNSYYGWVVGQNF